MCAMLYVLSSVIHSYSMQQLLIRHCICISFHLRFFDPGEGKPVHPLPNRGTQSRKVDKHECTVFWAAYKSLKDSLPLCDNLLRS